MDFKQFADSHKLTPKYISDIDLQDETNLKVLIVRSVSEETDPQVFKILNAAAALTNTLGSSFVYDFNIGEKVKLLLNYEYFRVAVGAGSTSTVLQSMVSNADDTNLSLNNLPADYINLMSYFPKHSQKLDIKCMNLLTFAEVLVIGIINEVVIPPDVDFINNVCIPLTNFYGSKININLKRPSLVKTSISYVDSGMPYLSFAYTYPLYNKDSHFKNIVWRYDTTTADNSIFSIKSYIEMNIHTYTMQWMGKKIDFLTEDYEDINIENNAMSITRKKRTTITRSEINIDDAIFTFTSFSHRLFNVSKEGLVYGRKLDSPFLAFNVEPHTKIVDILKKAAIATILVDMSKIFNNVAAAREDEINYDELMALLRDFTIDEPVIP